VDAPTPFFRPMCPPGDQRSTPIRLCLVEDHEGTREFLLKLLRREDGIVCLGAFGDGKKAVAEIPRLLPEVVLMDLHLPGLGGIECVRTLKRAHPQIEFVVLTTYDDTGLIFDALRAGASGYLLKRAALTELAAAIDEVSRGGSPMSMEIARRVVSHFRELRQPAADEEKLSNREREILELLAKGLTYKLIADRLGLSPYTVHNRLHGIYKKLQVQSRTEAVAKYLKN
jgi:DNA-binding NarL/FixJ family response regulator